MTSLEITLLTTTVVLSLFVFFLLAFIFWFFSKKNTTKNLEEKTELEKERNRNLDTYLKEISEKLVVIRERTEGNKDFGVNLSGLKDSYKETKSKIGDLISDFTKFNNAYENDIKSLESENQSTQKILNGISNVFSNFKRRGDLGEKALYFIVENVVGTESNSIVKKQHVLPNGNRPDLFLEGEEFGLPIDSKFPLDKFRELEEAKTNDDASHFVPKIKREIKSVIEKYMRDLSEKYIVPEKKITQVLLFLPSQSFFDLLYNDSFFDSSVGLASKKQIIICSPSTLPFILKNMIVIDQNYKKRKNITKIIDGLAVMKNNFKRHSERWQKIENRIEGLTKDVAQFNISDKKIKVNFDEIVSSKKQLNASKN